MTTRMYVRCDYEHDLGRCAALVERDIDLPADVDGEINRLAAIINIAVQIGWQAVNTRDPRRALTYCEDHHRGDVHAPCCSTHGHALTCEQYRRTHFVEVRPCCGFDAAVVLAAGSAGAALARVNAVEPGERVSFHMPREFGDTFAPSAADGLIGSTTTLRLPDNSTRPVKVVDASVADGNLSVTIEVEPGILPPDFASIGKGEVSLGYYTEPKPVARTPVVTERQTCPKCNRSIATYTPRGGDGSMALLRNHNGRGRTRCPGSKTEVS